MTREWFFDDALQQELEETYRDTGAGTMLPGAACIVDGLEAGAKKEGVLKAEDTFSDPQYHAKNQLSRSEFPKDA